MDQPISIVHPILGMPMTSPVVRRGIKRLSDLLLAGLAWFLADPRCTLAHFNSVRIIIWILTASIVGSLYQVTIPIYRLTSVKDVTRLGLATLTLMGLAALANFLPSVLALEPHAGVIALRAAVFTGVAWGLVRVVRRIQFETQFKDLFSSSLDAVPAHRTVLVGAGRAGSLVAQELLAHHELGYRIMGFLDDAPEKQGAAINGIRVLGPCSAIPEVIKEYGITHAVLAIPSAPGQVIRRLVEEFQRREIKVKTVPGIFNLLGAQTWKPDLQELSIEDILRRDPIRLDHSALSHQVAGKVVLITGAGGSIGGELAKQMAGLGPKNMVLLGRGENSLWRIQRQLNGLFPNQAISLELMDIRNRAGLREVFERYRPEIVLHAAAHKHVPFRLSPVKWCNKSGQRSAAVPVVEILVNAADADLLVRGGVEKREAIFQAEPAGVERVWTQRAPRRGVACGPEGRAAGPFREAKSSRQSSRLSIPAHRPGGRATISLL